MKKGTKLIRTKRPVSNLKMTIGGVYTYISTRNGFIKIEERKGDGHAWSLKNFEMANND